MANNKNFKIIAVTDRKSLVQSCSKSAENGQRERNIQNAYANADADTGADASEYRLLLNRLELLAASSVDAVILREKDLSEFEYNKLAGDALKEFDGSSTICILHSFADTAAELNCKSLHLPLAQLKMFYEERPDFLKRFEILGASVHSLAEAETALACGVSYVTAGHIFSTDCKKGVKPRGLEFLTEVVNKMPVPVYGIGGIKTENIAEIKAAGASGACIMSGYMKCPDVNDFTQRLRSKLNERINP